MEAAHAGRAHELIPFTGQTAGMISEVLPAAEIIGRIVAGAAEALAAAPAVLDTGPATASPRDG